MPLTDRRRALAMSLGLLAIPPRAWAADLDPEARLAAAGVTLPTLGAPLGAYAPFAIDGRLLFIAGQLPLKDGALTATGPVPSRTDIAAAQAAARQCAVNILAAAKLGLGGDLRRIRACLKLTGYVAADAGFSDHPRVVNGASELIGLALGDRGRHARAAVGVTSLPLSAPVEVDAVFAIEA
ncbi:RidA family protein [Phenylobacterium sp. J367]|uniref:RidA family protein n=1 Tax=Phenylobacterium sp. J367 TaxID=2898435 RepID=UPI002151D401|nr:RidA family protein [Phenylobacterium sp. J367]MCR5877222.1 RidA family protein [Phenylobacterium sp. J367]